MKDVGRNDPCPCGSGKKFKKCCLGKESAGAAFTAAERQRALEALVEFSLRAELDDERVAADIAFWSEWLRARGEEEGPPAMELPESIQAFHTWFCLDFRLADGGTVLDLVLRRRGTRLARGEREYLERMRATHLRPYQVTEVKADDGLRLVDLWTGEQVWVRERAGTHQLVRWDLLAVRLMRGADGDLVIDGMPYLYPAGSKAVLLRALRRAHRDFKRAAPFADLTQFFKRVGMAFHHFWLDTVALRPFPSLVTAEGDPLVFARATFDVRDWDTLRAALAGHPDLEREEGDGEAYAWLEDAPEFRRGLGRFVLKGDRLVFETQSRNRVERGRRFLESLAGDAVRFRLVRYEDPERAVQRVGASTRRQQAEEEVPPEVQAQVVGEFYEQHYRGWLDQTIPALGNRTPREAARLKRVRPKLVDLLQEFENMSARQRLAGKPAYDFGWMWAELGLEHPG
jgi:SEC-C motif-containing protein